VAVTNVTLEVVQREYHSLREASEILRLRNLSQRRGRLWAQSHFPALRLHRQGEILTELTLASDQEKRSSTSLCSKAFGRSRPPALRRKTHATVT